MSKEELTEVVSKRYFKVKYRKEKSVILDEYCQNTGYNRNYAIAKLKQCWRTDGEGKERKRRPRKYGYDLNEPLLIAWRTANHICVERFQPFLPELLGKLEQNGYLQIGGEQKKKLIEMSISTIKRRLRSIKEKHVSKGLSATKPGYLLKREIPIQTLCWDTKKAGYCEIDLVAHCGGSLSGHFIFTLQFVDIKTTWTERKAVMGKGQNGVFTAIKDIRKILPFDLLGIDSDNGGEFINDQLLRYCQKENIAFTRSRPYMSKDNAHIEQKNYTTVRKVLGYDRFDTEQHLQLINDLYDNELRLYINFFQPTMKLKEKKRIGSKYVRKYDNAKTPYQRVMESNEVSNTKKGKLKALYDSLDPVQLKQAIDRKVLRIIHLSKNSDY